MSKYNRTPITLSQFIKELQKKEVDYGNKELISIGVDTRGYFCPRVLLKDDETGYEVDSFDIPQYQEMIDK